MSNIVNYNSASSSYDNQRFAMGCDIIAAMLPFHCRKPLQDIHILDAGCGTGNYAKALIEYGIGHVTLLDASSGMLEKAKVKLADAIDAGKIKEAVNATMPTLPFPDASFDAVMYNLVLHHLEQNPDGENYPVIIKALTEARRVVKPDGVVIINSGAPARCYENIWYVHLNKEIAKRHLKHYPKDRMWHEICRKSGLLSSSYMDVNVNIPESTYPILQDPEGPLSKEWRDSNSYWGTVTEEELADIHTKIKDMKTAGTLEKFVKSYDVSNGFYNVFTLVFGKPM